MLPIPVPTKVVVVVSGKNCKETGSHSFHLLLRKKIDELLFFTLPSKETENLRAPLYPRSTDQSIPYSWWSG